MRNEAGGEYAADRCIHHVRDLALLNIAAKDASGEFMLQFVVAGEERVLLGDVDRSFQIINRNSSTSPPPLG
jgi:hypothetical protein